MIIMAKMMHTTVYEIKVRTVGNFGLPDKFSYHIQLSFLATMYEILINLQLTKIHIIV